MDLLSRFNTSEASSEYLKYSAIFTRISLLQPSQPFFAGVSESGVHHFKWHTAHACGRRRERLLASLEDDSDGEKAEKDLDLPISDRSQLSTTMILLLTG